MTSCVLIGNGSASHLYFEELNSPYIIPESDVITFEENRKRQATE